MSLRIAIVGGVAGGAGAAAAARRANEHATIDLFEAGPYISFANCGLPYYLSGEIDARDKLLVTSPERMRERFNVNVHVRHEVTAIDRDKRLIRVRDHAAGREFDHPYDRLIIATGAKPFRLPTAGLDHASVVECRTIDDVDRLAALALAHPGGRALVIGGGFIGIEVVEALVTRGIHVTLVDLAPQVLPPLDPEIAAAAALELEKHGVRLRLGVTVQEISHGPTGGVAVLSTGERVEHDFAVTAVGVQPETSLAKAAGLAIGATGGLVVDEHQRTSDPNIYAAGDVTELLYWPTQTRMKLALAGPANKQARAAGANAATETPTLRTTGAAGTAIVRVFDLAVGMTGLAEKTAVAKKVTYRVVYTQNGHHAGYFPGAKALFIKLVFSADDGRLLGGQIFGAAGVDKRIDVLATPIPAGFTVAPPADLDLAYAPPFGSAKDPIVIAGMVASNVYHGRTRIVTPRELAAELAGESTSGLSGSTGIPSSATVGQVRAMDGPGGTTGATVPLVVDVRTAAEHRAGRIGDAINLPIDELRGSLARLPKDRPIVVHCAVGYRGYLAERILRQNGFNDVRNLTGGHRAWELHASASGNPGPHL